MMRRLLAFFAVLVVALVSGPASARTPVQMDETDEATLTQILQRWVESQKDQPCTTDCFLLSRMIIRGKVGETLTFELSGGVRAREEQKIPLFTSPKDVRLDDVTLNGAPATLGFDNNSYFVFTASPTFMIRGKISLSEDLTLIVPGPLNTLDAQLASGRLVEGDKLAGISNQSLHFDPMTPESKSKTPTVFRMSRALHIGKEITFTYRVNVSQADPLGQVSLPLRYGEKIREVTGSEHWSQSSSELTLPVPGNEADLTITGVMPKLGTFTPDERSPYEWWLVESAPDFRVTLDGEGKLVENSQSPIPATLPTARTVLVQRGEHFEVDSKALTQDEALAAVARKETRIVVLTGRGEVVADDRIDYENNGLDQLMIEPGGRAIFLATDGTPERILHADGDRDHLYAPLGRGAHVLRLQTLFERGIGSFGGVLSVPMPAHQLTTSAVDVTVGMPGQVVPIAFFGGDRAHWNFAIGDLVAMLLGALSATFAFRTRKTRGIGAATIAGLWFVSHTAFLICATGLFIVGAIFLASRFLRGNAFLISGALLVAFGIIMGRAFLVDIGEPSHELFADPTEVALAWPATSGYGGGSKDSMTSLDARTGATPVSLALPTADVYVHTTRQLVSSERPFTPRLFYTTHATLYFLELAWAVLAFFLLWSHKTQLRSLVDIVRERLSRRPEAKPATEKAW